MQKSAALIILDGWGYSKNIDGNAVKTAKTPFLDKLKEEYPNTILKCSGEAVGLPEGVMGNSEVGHMNIGAGKIVYQDLLRINNSLKDGSFKKNKTIITLLNKLKENGGSFHLIGLLSDGGVHSHIDHLYAAIDIAVSLGIKTFLHPVLDGRDTPPDSGIGYLNKLQDYIRDKDFINIASFCGRYYAMDRDTRWERVEKAFRLYTEGIGEKAGNIETSVLKSYEMNEKDEFVKPHIIDEEGVIKDGDGVFFFNFRSDRAREISNAFVTPDFKGFKRKVLPKLSGYITMTSYDEKLSAMVAFPPQKLKGILGEAVSKKGLRQFRLAETEKYAHVTYFFNGGEEKPFPLEDRCLVDSPREIATYDEKPEMSAKKVVEQGIKRMDEADDALIVINFANMDMVGHTGILDVAVKAVETVDACVKEITEKALKKGIAVFISADHGNAEEMIGSKGPHTAHTLNPVPLIFVSGEKRELKKEGALCNIAPTILDYLNIEKPEEMDCDSLFIS